MDDFGIDTLLISSFIGHAMDLLGIPLPKVVVCHDYYPFCPALNVTFGGICRTCEHEEIAACVVKNPNNRFFRNVPALECLALRSRFLAEMCRHEVPLIAPSESVRLNYTRLAPELEGLFQVIPHGTRPLWDAPPRRTVDEERPLRILVLGSLAPHKGLDLLRQTLPDLRRFAEIFIVGCGEFGHEFEGQTSVSVIPQYQRADLPLIVERLSPDIGLALSVVPETFSYTLQELLESAIPVVATRIGSFVDRIRDGENGFLVEPTAVEVVSLLSRIADDRSMLRGIYERMCAERPRTAVDMLADYEGVLNRPPVSSDAYFCKDSTSVEETKTDIFELNWVIEGDSVSGEGVRATYPIHAETQSVRIMIPKLSGPPQRLTVSISSGEGFVLLYGINLQDDQGDCLCFSERGQGTMDFVLRNGASLSQVGGNGVLLYVYRLHPQIELSLPEFAAAKIASGGYLSCSFERVSWDAARSMVTMAALGGRLNDAVPPSPPVAGHVQQGSDLTAILRDSQARVKDLENSLSWKLSAPLRVAGGVVAKAAAAFGGLRNEKPSPRSKDG